LDEAIRIARETEEQFFAAELRRLRGEALLQIGNEGENALHCALTLARAQGARLWELRAAASLAHLWRGQGKRAQARDLLAPVYTWFNENFDTPDLKEAKALLDALNA
jgi:predicted ATPase